jgi:hypothetical protein
MFNAEIPATEFQFRATIRVIGVPICGPVPGYGEMQQSLLLLFLSFYKLAI